MKHTPTPWKEFAKGNVVEIIGSDGLPVVFWPGFDDSRRTVETHRANARLIVKAVNAYARLQAFEQAARDDYGKIAEFVQSLPRETRMKYFRPGRDMVPDLILLAAVLFAEQEAG